MKKYIIAITFITLGGIALKGLIYSGEKGSEDWQPPTQEELMRYTETTACMDSVGRHEPSHIVH